MTDWSIEHARKLYAVPYWSAGHFDIDENGALCAMNRVGKRLPLPDLTDNLLARGLRLPVLVRFNHILRERLDALAEAFSAACRHQGFTGTYTALYPIKVNQQRSVVEEILNHGGERVGLEAGSKPELIAVLAQSRAGGVVVCNGYKDREYMRLALIGRRLGHRVYIVIEKPSEVAAIIEASRAMGVRPLLGVRVRLASIGNGKWQNSGGEKGKFGLSAAQLITVVEALREAGMLDCLHLLHFHMGSQIANIRDIQRGVREATRFYLELLRLGVGLKIFDVGGGLGVDYEGARSRHEFSMNYSVAEYAESIVRALRETCEENNAPHPEIFTEAGRAMTAHHAVLITDIIDVETAPQTEHIHPPAEDAPLILRDMWALLQRIGEASPSEIFHEAGYWLSEAHGMYTHGLLDLEARARVEELFSAICQRLAAASEEDGGRVREMRTLLRERLADKVFCNFSIFQSTPDIWGIDQVFPVMPLQRLGEKPLRRGILQDLTCDSDGQIERYVVGNELERSLPMHSWKQGECYLLGIFLVGAYQEILGDLHNLFGDTDAVNVDLHADGRYELARPESGDTVAELLDYVHFDSAALMHAFRAKAKMLSPQMAEAVLAELEEGLNGYSYLED